MSERKGVLLRFPPALLARVDRARGNLNRHAFLIDVIERGTQDTPPERELTADGCAPSPGLVELNEQHPEVRAESSDSSLDEAFPAEQGRVARPVGPGDDEALDDGSLGGEDEGSDVLAEDFDIGGLSEVIPPDFYQNEWDVPGNPGYQNRNWQDDA